MYKIIGHSEEMGLITAVMFGSCNNRKINVYLRNDTEVCPCYKTKVSNIDKLRYMADAIEYVMKNCPTIDINNRTAKAVIDNKFRLKYIHGCTRYSIDDVLRLLYKEHC